MYMYTYVYTCVYIYTHVLICLLTFMITLIIIIVINPAARAAPQPPTWCPESYLPKGLRTEHNRQYTKNEQ